MKKARRKRKGGGGWVKNIGTFKFRTTKFLVYG